MISLFVTVLWAVLLCESLRDVTAFRFEYYFITSATFATCIAFVTFGRTQEGAYRHVAIRRKTSIDPLK